MRARAVMRDESGVTLVEVFVVVTILGLLSIAVLPLVGTFLQDTKAKGAAQQVAGALRQARQNAISAAATYTVTISSTTITTACADGVPAGNVCPANRPPDRVEDIIADATMSPSVSPFMLGPTGGSTLGTVDVSYAGSQWQISLNQIGGVRVCTPTCS